MIITDFLLSIEINLYISYTQLHTVFSMLMCFSSVKELHHLLQMCFFNFFFKSRLALGKLDIVHVSNASFSAMQFAFELCRINLTMSQFKSGTHTRRCSVLSKYLNNLVCLCLHVCMCVHEIRTGDHALHEYLYTY